MIYSGRLVAGKNVDLIIRLFNDLSLKYVDLELHIAGDGILRAELEKQAMQIRNSSKVYFHGFVEDMESFYIESDFLVHLSSHESFGNVLIEALLTGMPVFASRIPAFEEILEDGDSFILGSPDDLVTISSNLDNALTNFEEFAEKAYLLSDNVAIKFSIEKHLAEIEKLYK